MFTHICTGIFLAITDFRPNGIKNDLIIWRSFQDKIPSSIISGKNMSLEDKIIFVQNIMLSLNTTSIAKVLGNLTKHIFVIC